jgi:hypothetical protein
VRIDVTFEINSDGIVNVTARDRDTGRQAGAAITLSSGLSAQELESIVAEQRTDRVVSPAAPAAGAAPAAEGAAGDELEVLDDADLESLLEADVEMLGEAAPGLIPTPPDPALEATAGEKLFESGDFDLSNDDTQGTREG